MIYNTTTSGAHITTTQRHIVQHKQNSVENHNQTEMKPLIHVKGMTVIILNEG